MALSLEESARLAGGFCWTERRLFEVVGGWVSTTGDETVKLMLDRHSQHHAWRARQWWERLPVLADMDREALVAPPDAGAGGLIGALGDLQPTVRRLAGLYRVVVPRLNAAYRVVKRSADPVADSSLLWIAGIVAAEATSDWLEGEEVLQSLLGTAEAIVEAADVVVRLETMLAGTGTTGMAAPDPA